MFRLISMIFSFFFKNNVLVYRCLLLCDSLGEKCYSFFCFFLPVAENTFKYHCKEFKTILMATINFQLSSKVRKDKNDYQILLRFSFNRQTVLRAKTNLYVQGKNWDAKKQKMVIPRVRVNGMEEIGRAHV